MAEQKRQPTAEVHQSVSYSVSRTITRRHRHRNRNYPTLKINQGKETIYQYMNGALKTIEHSYRNLIK